MFTLLVSLSALSFLFYGIGCLALEMMEREFERYGFGAYRKLIGITQILAAGGLFWGFFQPLFGLIAAGGLALQMLFAVGVRIKIKDTVLQTVPALAYCLLNSYLFFRFWEKCSL